MQGILFFRIIAVQNILRQRRQILFLLVDHFTFQRQRKFLDAGYRNGYGFFKRQAKFFDFIHISSGSPATDTQYPFVYFPYRNIDSEFLIILQQLLGIAAFPNKGNKNRNFPFNANMAPANGHGIDFLVTFCGQQNTGRQSLADLSCIVKWINFPFHMITSHKFYTILPFFCIIVN